MKSRKLRKHEIVEDGDEYLENGKWHPCVAEDFAEPVAASGYEAVRRTIMSPTIKELQAAVDETEAILTLKKRWKKQKKAGQWWPEKDEKK
jgi:hypothetical protein